MVWKILTAITEIEATEVAVEAMLTYGLTRQETARLLAELEGKKLITYPALRFINVQRLMMYLRLIDTIRITPFTIPPETNRRILMAQRLPFEMEEYKYKGILPQREIEREQTARRETLRTEEIKQKVRLLKLHQQAITCIEQRALANLESYLYTFQLEWYEKILLKIIDMCKAKQLYLERIVGKEALEKLLIQLYVPFYMEYPQKLNMIALRLTQATMLYASGISGTLYRAVSSTGQAIKTKMQLVTTQKRRLETKAVASGKKRKEPFQTKGEGGITESLSKKDKIGMGKGLTGKEYAVLSVSLAYGLPYYIKRMFARSIGLPENSKLYRRPYISFIPVRRTLRRSSFGKRRHTDITTFSRDEYIKNMRKWRSRNG